MRKVITVCFVLAFFSVNHAKAAGVYKIVDSQLPGAKADSTQIIDIDGSNTVGQYRKSADNSPHAFLYNVDAESWTAIDPIDATGGAWPVGISGDKVVGGYNILQGEGQPNKLLFYLYDGGKQNWTALDVPGISGVNGVLGNSAVGGYIDTYGAHRGFLYDATGQTWATFEPLGATSSYPVSVSGSQVVGSYYNDTGKHTFLYDGDKQTWATLDMPGVSSQLLVYPHGVDANNIVGTYQEGSTIHGFLYDGTNWTTLDMLGATRTDAVDISGNSIVGSYTDVLHDQHGFLYDLSDRSWTTIDPPGSKYTAVSGIEGDKIIGYFNDPQGFVYTIPEPSSFALLIAALLSGFLLYRKFKSLRLN